MTCQEWGPVQLEQDRREILFDVSAVGAQRLMAWAETETLVVCVCQFFIPHPRRNDPVGELRFHSQNLNTCAWESRRPHCSSAQLGSSVSPLTCEGWNVRVVGQTRIGR